MSTVLYEHPLNERIRNYLKLEQLFAQANRCIEGDLQINNQVFFNSLFAIIDTLERCDIRGDLIKDMEKLEQNLVIWSKSPDIDTSALEDNLSETVKLISRLRSNKPTWYQLKDNKFLAGLKQRFAIQGGSSSFDLPQLTFWLNQPHHIIQQEVVSWITLLNDVNQALKLVLRFIRQRAEFETINTDSGFYQDNGEGLLLLRIKLAQNLQYYPTVSGNKFRYSIRFMLPCQHTGRRYSNQATEFQLARC
ncbi:cell division protein ZapD [Colwellia sp. D2M02]|uniref:cell division protein ZapD n=1 Tax=Colwellia sp. D2M02 TaxID=2841562 RepID=UPI001C08A901|nr:cell division protein ZapD [Colwellia sp. D2M02]MBU2894825.1 cell division protein ZapD [Colwellia sp. D2M02]